MLKFFGENEDIPDVIEMILKHIIRLAKSNADLTKETIAVKLDRKDLEELLKVDKTTDLVAFFGVDKDNTSTVIVTSLDKDGYLIKSGSGYLAKERWTRIFLKAEEASIAKLKSDVFK